MSLEVERATVPVLAAEAAGPALDAVGAGLGLFIVLSLSGFGYAWDAEI